MRLRVRAFGMAGGVVLGLAYCIMIDPVSHHWTRADHWRDETCVTVLRKECLSVWCMDWLAGSLKASVVGAFFAWLYNKFHEMLYGSAGAS